MCDVRKEQIYCAQNRKSKFAAQKRSPRSYPGAGFPGLFLVFARGNNTSLSISIECSPFYV
jgi:hypothetical protein